MTYHYSAYHYSDPSRASDPHALPNIETFRMNYCANCSAIQDENESVSCDADCDSPQHERAWFWQACFPSCLPDGEPSGPFATEADALADARSF